MSEWKFDAFLGGKQSQQMASLVSNKELVRTKTPWGISAFLGTGPECIRVCEGDLNQAHFHRAHFQLEYISYIRGI